MQWIRKGLEWIGTGGVVVALTLALAGCKCLTAPTEGGKKIKITASAGIEGIEAVKVVAVVPTELDVEVTSPGTVALANLVFP